MSVTFCLRPVISKSCNVHIILYCHKDVFTDSPLSIDFKIIASPGEPFLNQKEIYCRSSTIKYHLRMSVSLNIYHKT